MKMKSGPKPNETKKQKSLTVNCTMFFSFSFSFIYRKKIYTISTIHLSNEIDSHENEKIYIFCVHAGVENIFFSFWLQM